MQKTKIEWCDYTVNPIKGMCPNNCWYCYARRMYKRFKWNPEIRLDLKCLDKIEKIKKPSRIFVGSMHDIFGNWIPNYWIKKIIKSVEKYKKHTFIFLTKFPSRYQYYDFPENCWLGITLTGKETKYEIINKYYALDNIIKNIKFISFEPLLSNLALLTAFIPIVDWIIIGGLTPKSTHKKEWVDLIINQANSLNIPIFIKDNLKWEEKIQEFPKVM